MKAIKNIVTVGFLLFAIGFTACEKYADDTPQAIKKLIREKCKRGNFVSVGECKCNEKTIYYFKQKPMINSLCDIYDKDGVFLCQIGGGNGTSGCEEYMNCCIEAKIIWTKN